MPARIAARAADTVAAAPAGGNCVAMRTMLNAGRRSRYGRWVRRGGRRRLPHGAACTSTQGAAEAGLNATSAMVYVSRSPLFRTVARGRYALRGAGAALAEAA